MQSVKILENKTVIRFFGIALFLAPIISNFIALSLHTEIENHWRIGVFLNFLTTVPVAHRIIDAFSLVVGIAMLGGSPSTWKFILFILLGKITLQVAHFNRDVLKNWVSFSFFLVNIIIFSFLAYQFVWKEKPAVKKNPENRPIPKPAAQQIQTQSVFRPKEYVSSKVIKIHFSNHGPWAKLVNISKDEIHVRSTGQLPAEIEHREIEIVFRNNLVIKAMFARQLGPDYFFTFKEMSSEKIKALNSWLLSTKVA